MNKITVCMLEWDEKKGHSDYVYHKKFVNAGAALNAVNRLHKQYPNNERIQFYCEYPFEYQHRKSKEKFTLDCNEDSYFPINFPDWLQY